jgi:HlyD family secretion protein
MRVVTGLADYELQQKEYQSNEVLEKEKVIAPIELAQNKSKLLGKKQSQSKFRPS